MLLEPIKGILEVARVIAGAVGKLLSYRKERRGQVADYFDRIAHTLASCGKDFRKGITHDELVAFCGQLQGFAEQLPGVIGDVVGEEKAEELKRLLSGVNQGKLHELEGGDPDALHHLAALSKAAGYFSASAESLRAAP